MDRRGFLGTSLFGAAAAALQPLAGASAVAAAPVPLDVALPLATPYVASGVSSLIPGAMMYPLSLGPPLDRCYLVPLQAQLYDSEVVQVITETLECNGKELYFFKRPISNWMQYAPVMKDFSDTNLNQSSMLDYPREFNMTGVGVFFNQDISAEDKAQLIDHGTLMVILGGNRPYSIVPLMLMPVTCDEAAMKAAEAEATPLFVGVAEVERKSRVRAGFYPLKALPIAGELCMLPGPAPAPKHIKPDPYRLKPGEAFAVKLQWDKPIKLSKPVKIMVALDGYFWQPV